MLMRASVRKSSQATSGKDKAAIAALKDLIVYHILCAGALTLCQTLVDGKTWTPTISTKEK
jgi:hypothetical protein